MRLSLAIPRQCRRLAIAPAELTVYVCKYLRADANGRFSRPVDNVTAPYTPAADAGTLDSRKCKNIPMRQSLLGHMQSNRMHLLY